jgi:hypothetical protein
MYINGMVRHATTTKQTPWIIPSKSPPCLAKHVGNRNTKKKCYNTIEISE